ncbi:MAG TPA: DNA-directed RNA polymerase subunit omega [Pyrinomonadaceae bacterium]|jgi:DNA-directed RNA polymerase omega subunit|nr:DNA-directed RNA polymerase subunit omega [Pyrinomonadaceae bacterium]
MPTSMDEIDNSVDGSQSPEVDSKYRLIILAAKRSKQLQRGAQPRIDIDPQKHKPTRIALEEVIRGRVHFSIKEEEIKSPAV